MNSDDGAWLLQLSDIHADADRRIVYGVDWRDHLCRLLEAAHDAVPVAAAILTGDVADDGAEATYGAVASVLADWPCLDARLVAGNHDDGTAMTAALSPQYLDPLLRVGDRWQVLLVDSSVPGAVFGRVGTDQLAWLEERLKATEDIWTVLAVHHPPRSRSVPPIGTAVSMTPRACSPSSTVTRP